MRVVFVILVVLVFGAGYAGPPRLPLWGERPDLRIVPLAPPAVRRNGRLMWLAGAKLDSGDPAFGGWSALAVTGRQLTLLNDGGNLVRFDLGPGWRPGDVRFLGLPDGPRIGWEKRDRDSESLTRDPDGSFRVGFESDNAIWRYTPDFTRALSHAKPGAMQGWNRNGGPESLVRVRDGPLAVISETSRWPDQPGRAAFVFVTDPALPTYRGFRFTYRPAPGFDPSDATVLPNGDLLVLERWWAIPYRFRSRVALVRRAAIQPEAVVSGIEVGRIAPPWPTENYEGISAAREGKATVLWLVSDNDQTWWRSSYLLKLRLD